MALPECHPASRGPKWHRPLVFPILRDEIRKCPVRRFPCRLVGTHRLQPATVGWATVAEHHQRLWREALQVERRDLAVYEEVAQWS